MMVAADLRTGKVLQLEGNLWRVISAEYHMGSGKMGGLVQTKLRRLDTGALVDRKFKPDERIEEVTLKKRVLQYLYSDQDGFVFMDPETYDQISLPRSLVEDYEPFMEDNMSLPVEFRDEQPVNLLFPEFVELKVVSTPPALSSLQDEVYKPATLSNDIVVQVPQFIKEGDTIKVDVSKRRYVERVRK